MLDSLLEDSELDIYPTPHKPYKNDLSINLATKKRFVLEEEMKLFNDLVFGIYKKEIKA